MSRLRRKTYVLRSIGLFIIMLMVMVYVQIESHPFDDTSGQMITFLSIPYLIWLSQAYYRLQDINVSGWYVLLFLIPLVGLMGLILFFIPGTNGPNKYGADPKALDDNNNEQESNFQNDIDNDKNTDKTVSKINELINKNELLKESLDLNLITEEEFKEKEAEIIDEKNNLKYEIMHEKELVKKSEKLRTQRNKLDELWKAGLITQEEYKNKLNEIEKA